MAEPMKSTTATCRSKPSAPAASIELTDRADVINTAIAQAKTDERSWPHVQYLWDGHPILDWFGDRAETFFPEQWRAVCNLAAALPPARLPSSCMGQSRTSLARRWWTAGRRCQSKAARRHGPDRGGSAISWPGRPCRKTSRTTASQTKRAARKALAAAVDAFQSHLVDLRKQRGAEIEKSLNAILERLAGLEARFRRQLELNFADIPANARVDVQQRAEKDAGATNASSRDRQDFDDWTAWHQTGPADGGRPEPVC